MDKAWSEKPSSFGRSAFDISGQGRPLHYLLSEEEWRNFLLSGEHKLSLLACWVDEHYATMLLLDNEVPLLLSTRPVLRRYFAPSSRYPSALWGEMMARDLWGVEAVSARDDRGEVFDAGSWTQTWPLTGSSLRAEGADPNKLADSLRESRKTTHILPFSQTGIPGALEVSFRSGETVEKSMIFRLSAVHRGLVSLLLGKTPEEALPLLSRVSAGGFVAYPVAFLRALEQAQGRHPTPAQRDYRLLLLELERITLHLFDLARTGFYGDLALLASYSGQIREEIAQCYTQNGLPHRLTDMLNLEGEGQERIDAVRAAAQQVSQCIRKHLPSLAQLHGRLIRRFSGMAHLSTERAWDYGVGGASGRASGRAVDMRCHEPGIASAHVTASAGSGGDIPARGRQRLAEIRDSVMVLEAVLAQFAQADFAASAPEGQQNIIAEGLGVAESARGDIWCWLTLGCDHKIETLHMRDPALPLLSALEACLNEGEWGDIRAGNLLLERPEAEYSLALMLGSFGLSPAGAAL